MRQGLSLLREHDACGIGAVVKIDGVPEYSVMDDALAIVEKLEHRAGKDASGTVGDGVGILVGIAHSFFKKAAKEAGLSIGEAGEYGIGIINPEIRDVQILQSPNPIGEKSGANPPAISARILSF